MRAARERSSPQPGCRGSSTTTSRVATEPRTIRVSPALADDAALARSPATLVIRAEHDPLRDEGEADAKRLQGVGVPASSSRYGGMFHAFVSFAEFLDDGRRTPVGARR